MPKYNTKESQDKVRNINYLNKDFKSLKSDLINYAKTYFPNTYNDFNETSPGMMMMEMSAYVGDVLSFYIDEQFKEMITVTAEERRNLIYLAKSMGYRVKTSVPSFVELTFKHTVPHDPDSPDSNRTPNYSQLMTFDKGLMVAAGTNSDTIFETVSDLDFSITGSGENSPTPSGQDSNGLTNTYEVERKVLAISGKTKTYTFTINSPKQFMRLTLPDNNVISVESVIDSNGREWYQVDYLAQDKVYKKSKREDPYLNSDYSPVQYTLDPAEYCDSRFVVETNPDNTTSLVFGNGLIRGKNDTSYIENVYLENKDMNSLIFGTLPSEINPMTNFYNSSLGESPSNTTLTVTYRCGGGLSSNVGSNTLNSILNSTGKASGDITRLSTLSVVNSNPATGGADEESIEEIKEKIKATFSSQNRAVTREDYENRVLSMPSEFGSVAKVFVRRKDVDDTSLQNLELQSFNLDTTDAENLSIVGGETDAAEFDAIIERISGGDTSTDSTAIANIRQFIVDLGNISQSDLFLFKNLEVYVLSYDSNKNLIKTSNPIKTNITNYLSKFKILTDDVDIKDGHVVNFGVYFRVEARENVNKSDLKLRIISEIRDYFEIDSMRFNQVIHTKDLSNLIYNIDGVKIIHDIRLTQDANLLMLNDHIYAHTGDGTGVSIEGQPSDGVGGPTNSTYGFGYQTEFNNFYSNHYGTGAGVIIPPNADETPTVFELKNPLANIKGVIE